MDDAAGHPARPSQQEAASRCQVVEDHPVIHVPVPSQTSYSDRQDGHSFLTDQSPMMVDGGPTAVTSPLVAYNPNHASNSYPSIPVPNLPPSQAQLLPPPPNINGISPMFLPYQHAPSVFEDNDYTFDRDGSLIQDSGSTTRSKRRRERNRPNHNEVERNRRIYQRQKLEELRQTLPGLDPSVRTTITTVIVRAKDYIDALETRINELENQLEQLHPPGSYTRAGLPQLPLIRGQGLTRASDRKEQDDQSDHGQSYHPSSSSSPNSASLAPPSSCRARTLSTSTPIPSAGLPTAASRKRKLTSPVAATVGGRRALTGARVSDLRGGNDGNMSTVLASSHDPRQQVPQPGLTDAGSVQYPAPFSAPANLMMSFAFDQLGGPSSNATNRLSGCPLDANPTLGLVASSVAGHTVDSQSYANDSINLPLSPVPMTTNTWRPGHSDIPPPGAAFPAPLASPSLDDSTRVSQSPFVNQPTPNAAIHPAVDISNGLDYVIVGSSSSSLAYDSHSARSQDQYPSGTGTAQHHGTNVTSPIPHAYAYVPVSTVDPHGCESVYVPGAIHRCVSLAPSLTRDSVPDSTLVRVDSASMFGQDQSPFAGSSGDQAGGPRSRSDSTATLDAKAHASPGLVANSHLQPSLGRQAF